MIDRDEFHKKTIRTLAMRASYICSNPDCRCLTLCPSIEDDKAYIYTGKAAHITAASENGPRYDKGLSAEQRLSIENGIFLCSNCADMIDKNRGKDFSVALLKQWKKDHEQWARENLNKSSSSIITIINGEHAAEGIGEITGLKVYKPAIIQPGTKSMAKGIGKVTGTQIGGERREKE